MIKKHLLIALLCMICAAGCVGDILDITDDPASSSGGDGLPDGSISEVDFNGEVTVTYSSDGASVSGTSDQFSVATDGGSVVITYTGSDNILYILKGESANGSFKLYSEARQAVRLDGLNLTNPAGAAINIQSGHLTYMDVTGINSLSDSGSAQYPTDGEDCKGVLFSEGSLLFSGSGSLTINCLNSAGKSGIVSDDHIAFSDSPAITVTAGSAAGHGVKANDYVQISGGNLDITARAAMKKGITSDDYVLVEGGSTTINISGGVAYDSEDGEYTGSAGIKADNFFGMTGGTVTITNTGNGGTRHLRTRSGKHARRRNDRCHETDADMRNLFFHARYSTMRYTQSQWVR
ncbi:MAG: carbohydrate-binding domain-containing protein, partial [Bacteroidales bacterium]|nr:carbohydrate-binding domain-containing protein [Bacteroidales bacterium]